MNTNELCGWVDDPRAVADVVGRWSDPILGLAVSREFLATEHRDVLLWEQGEIPIFGSTLPAHRQTIGDCLPAGTMVSVKAGHRPIETIKVGDTVRDAYRRPTRVISQRVINTARPLVRLTTDRGSIEATPDHRIRAFQVEEVHHGSPASLGGPMRWVNAGDVAVGDRLIVQPEGKRTKLGLCSAKVTRVDYIEGPHTVYDIGVESADHSFIANGVVVHNCVSHGWGRAIQDLIFVELAQAIAAGRLTQAAAKAVALEVATEAIYALSRVEIGRGRLGRGDGSIGAWAAEAVIRYGNLLRKAYGSVDLSEYSGQRAKQWGAPGAGLPDDLEPTARQYVVSKAPLVSTSDELLAALYNMYPVPICSQQGFAETRDKYGFCDPRGSWAHCMVVRGVAKLRRAGQVVLSGFIQQSWGGNPNGPDVVTLDTGREVKLPQGVFAVEIDVIVSRILKMRDSFAPAGPQGFLPREPNFTI